MPREPTPLDQRWWLRLLPSPVPRPADSLVSIRSIRARDAKTFFRVTSLLWLAALMRVAISGTVSRPTTTTPMVLTGGWASVTSRSQR